VDQVLSPRAFGSNLALLFRAGKDAKGGVPQKTPPPVPARLGPYPDGGEKNVPSAVFLVFPRAPGKNRPEPGPHRNPGLIQGGPLVAGVFLVFAGKQLPCSDGSERR